MFLKKFIFIVATVRFELKVSRFPMVNSSDFQISTLNKIQ
jgi:hypothetical protein